MKKILCFLAALILCLSAAMAESVPSKSTADLTEVKDVVAENMPADSGFTFEVVTDEAAVTVANTEIEKLAKAADVETYFGTVVDAQGNEVSLKEMLQVETVNVYEFAPIVAAEYEESYGKVTVTMTFSTPYAENEKVIVLVGLVTVNEDNSQSVVWTAFEGVAVADGGIQVEFDEQTIKSIQDGTALIAVVSK